MSAISREKALRLFGGLEAPHLLFTQARGLVRIFRTIVQDAGADGAPSPARFRVAPRHSSSAYQ
jgi:hypothetical protein